MEHRPTKPKIVLPIIALMLNILPFLLFLMTPSIIILFLISIFPFIGFILGIVALCKGKKRIGTPGLVLASLAVAWPLVFFITFLLLEATGSLMPIM